MTAGILAKSPTNFFNSILFKAAVFGRLSFEHQP